VIRAAIPGLNVARSFYKQAVFVALLIGGCLVNSVAAGAVEAQASPGAAATASDRKAPDPRALGVTEALLDYCAKSDPTDAAKVHNRLKRLMQGASKEALADVRKSSEYQSAHDSEVDFIGKIEPRNAHRLCSGSAAASK
jgi:hypothetical protein